MPLPSETPTQRAQRLMDECYNNMYVEIHALSHTFRFPKPTIKWFIDGLKDKVKQQLIIMIDDFLLSLTDSGLDSDAIYSYWQDVKTAVQNL